MRDRKPRYRLVRCVRQPALEIDKLFDMAWQSWSLIQRVKDSGDDPAKYLQPGESIKMDGRSLVWRRPPTTVRVTRDAVLYLQNASPL